MSACRRVVGADLGHSTTLCGHTNAEHGWVQGEAGEWRPCSVCRCVDYLPPDGLSYFEEEEITVANQSATSSVIAPPTRLTAMAHELDLRLDRMLNESHDPYVLHLNRVLRELIEHVNGAPIPMPEPTT